MNSEPRVLSGRYRVDDIIGQGGMATVYRGYDLTLGRPVAVKILDAQLAEDTAFRTRFRLEAQAASRMSSPSIVRVFDAGEDAEVDAEGKTRPIPYIVMELVHGRLLKDIVDEGQVDTGTAIRYVDGILEALEYSHRAGVVHRDIKPGNVMVTDHGQVKVMDFGIARAVSDSSSTVADTTTILGTAAYFSPEQAKGESVDARADLYSTGVVLYELLAGRQPFRGESAVAVAYQHVSETPVAPSELTPGVPGALDAVVLRAMAKDPYQRYQSAAQFRHALTAAQDAPTPSKKHIGELSEELYGPNPRHAADTSRTLRQLSTDTSSTPTQAGPPAAWIWAGVAVIAVVVFALAFWLVTIRPWAEAPSTARIIPELSGESYENALNTLGELDLNVIRVDQSSISIEQGLVIRTEPEAGISVGEGTEVRVFVSTGVQKAVVPEVEGLSETEATELLTKAGLKVGQVSTRSVAGQGAGSVLESAPAAGEEVETGTIVNLTVATGRVWIVDYTGKWTVESAVQTVEGPEIGLTAQTEADPSCEAQEPAIVRSQSLPAGEVAVGSTIVFTYCSG